jgi:hypothetical protein
LGNWDRRRKKFNLFSLVADATKAPQREVPTDV